MLYRVLCLSIVCATTASSAPADTTTVDRTKDATSFVALLAKGGFTEAVNAFDTTMRDALPELKLRDVWNSLIAQTGAFVKQRATRIDRTGGYQIVFVTCEFERANLDAKVVYNAEGKVAGLFFLPSPDRRVPNTPPYVSEDAFDEVEIMFGEAPWVLPGTISLPKGDGPFPAVVLVHGSGPQDRDETVAANKPFRDLAWGLASRGVAVLRYEKRTKQHAKALDPLPLPFTVKEETVDDAVAAFKALAERKGVDSEKVYVLGHSLGGMLIPRIAERLPRAAGYIILAGTTRHLEDVILEQSSYIALLDGNTSVEEQKQLDAVQQEVNRIKKLTKADLSNPALIFGAPACYWFDLRIYDPAQKAKQVSKPLLVLQGERDYQVTMADFTRWKETLSGNTNATLKSYPGLNHLLVQGNGPSAPTEYASPGHVSQQVIEDIAAWIKQ